MTKCRCIKCGDEQAYEDHKKAWLDGWDFVNGKQYCGKCSVMPAPQEVADEDEDEDE